MNKQRLIEAFEQNKPCTPMTEDEMRMFLYISMSENEETHKDINELDKESEIYKQLKPLIKGFQMQVFLKRLEHLAGLKISIGAFALIAVHLESAGAAVMYAYYMFYKLPKNCFVGINEVATKLFPWGFFSDEQLKKIWDVQKIKVDDGLDECTCYGAHDNLLDYVETWKKE